MERNTQLTPLASTCTPVSIYRHHTDHIIHMQRSIHKQHTVHTYYTYIYNCIYITHTLHDTYTIHTDHIHTAHNIYHIYIHHSYYSPLLLTHRLINIKYIYNTHTHKVTPVTEFCLKGWHQQDCYDEQFSRSTAASPGSKNILELAGELFWATIEGSSCESFPAQMPLLSHKNIFMLSKEG